MQPIKSVISDAAQDIAIETMAKLYSFPGVAQAREFVFGNAVDEHQQSRALGRDVPNKVQAIFRPIREGSDEGLLLARDYGRGMDYDRLTQVYINYHPSEKRTDSTVSGAFGIGSKCWVAATTSFSVRSRSDDGITWRLVAQFHPGDGIHNTITDVSDTDPLDHTGTEVRVRIPSEHVNALAAYLMVGAVTLDDEVSVEIDTEWVLRMTEENINESRRRGMQSARYHAVKGALGEADDSEGAKILSREITQRSGVAVTVLPSRVRAFAEAAVPEARWTVSVKGLAYQGTPFLPLTGVLIDAESVLTDIPRNRETANLRDQGAQGLRNQVSAAIKEVLTELSTDGNTLADEMGFDHLSSLALLRTLSDAVVFRRSFLEPKTAFRLTWGGGGFRENERPTTLDLSRRSAGNNSAPSDVDVPDSYAGTHHVILGLDSAADIRNAAKIGSNRSKVRQSFNTWAEQQFPDPSESDDTEGAPWLSHGVRLPSRTCTVWLGTDPGAAAVRMALLLPRTDPGKYRIEKFSVVTNTTPVARAPRPKADPAIPQPIKTYDVYKFTWNDLMELPEVLRWMRSARVDVRRSIDRAMVGGALPRGEIVKMTSDEIKELPERRRFIPSRGGQVPTDPALIPYLREILGEGRGADTLYLLLGAEGGESLPGWCKVKDMPAPKALIVQANNRLGADRDEAVELNDKIHGLRTRWSAVVSPTLSGGAPEDEHELVAEINKYLRRSGDREVYRAWDAFRSTWETERRFADLVKKMRARTNWHRADQMPTELTPFRDFCNFAYGGWGNISEPTELAQKLASWIDYTAEQAMVFNATRAASGACPFTEQLAYRTDSALSAIPDVEDFLARVTPYHGPVSAWSEKA